jgi:serine/threonine protein kinase/Flp pilus assembly protein TadD
MSSDSEGVDRVPPSGRSPEGATRRVGRRSHSSRGSRGTGSVVKALRLPEVGERLFGFRLRGELGRGAYARVFLAEQADLAGRPVVLKVSAIDGDEPQTLAQLQHTHIVPIYSVHEDASAGIRAVCMPYFGGASLSVVLHKVFGDSPRPARGEQLVSALLAVAALVAPIAVVADAEGAAPALSVGTGPTALDDLRGMSYLAAAAWVVERLALALHHAHRRGVIHRDIKPSNVLLGADGQPMLLDFNVAENSRGSPVRAVLGGTIAYMAPEHLRALANREPAGSRGADHRADIYSLGIVLFEILAGGRPFEQTGSYAALVPQMLAMALERSQSRPSLRRHRPDAPWSLESITRRCLAADPARRYQTAEELAEDLRRFLADLPLKHAPELSLRERADKWLRRHPRLTSSGTVATAAAALIAIGGASFVGVQRHLERTREELAVAQAQDGARRFTEGVVRAQCLVNTTTEVQDHLRQGAAVCEETLALFGVLGRDDWQRGADWRRLSPEERTGLAEDVRELLVLLAEARVATAPGDDNVLRDALGLLDRAEAVEGLPPSRALGEDRARYLEKLGRVQEARAARAAAEAVPPRTARDHYLLAAARARQGRDADAVAELDRAIELNPRHYWSLTLRGICHLEMGKPTEAVADFAACTGLWPEFAWSYFNLAYARAKAGDRDGAVGDYGRALRRDPGFVLAYLNRGMLHSERKEYEPALADLRQAAGLGRDDTYLHLGLGVALEGLGRAAEADEEFRAAAERAREAPRAVRVRAGWVYGFAVAARLPGPALEAFEGVLRLDPDEPQALYGRGMLLMQQGRDAEALPCFNRVVQLAPQLVEARRYRAIVLARLGRLAPASEDANWCLRQQPDDGAAYYAAACVAALAVEVYGHSDAAGLATEQALALLEQAFARGYGRDRAANDADLRAVHHHPRFEKLLKGERQTPPAS